MPLASSLDWWCTDIDGDALTFDVYFGVAPDLPLIASNVSGTTYNPGLLANDTQYNWYVVARDSHGAEARSSTALFSTRPVNFVPTEPSNPSPPATQTIPAMPTNVTATALGPNTVRVAWTDNATNETGFYVERALKSGKGAGVYARVATVPAGVTAYSETVAAGSYYYRVQAFNTTTGRVSAYSNTATATAKGR